MTETELEDIVQATKQLKEAQLREDSPEDLATIPALRKTDMETQVLGLGPKHVVCDSAFTPSLQPNTTNTRHTWSIQLPGSKLLTMSSQLS